MAILAFSKLKALHFADDKSEIANIVQLFLDGIENIVGKGENARNQHFFSFSTMFQKSSFPGSLKRHCCIKASRPKVTQTIPFYLLILTAYLTNQARKNSCASDDLGK